MPDGGREAEAPEVVQPDVVQPEGGGPPEPLDDVHVEDDGAPEALDVALPEGDGRSQAVETAQPESQEGPAEAETAPVPAPKERGLKRGRRKAPAVPEHWLKGEEAPFAPEVELTPVRESQAPAAPEPGAAEQRLEPAESPPPASPPPEPPPEPSPLATTLRSFARSCARARRRAAFAVALLRRAARRLARAAGRSRSRPAGSAGEAAVPREPGPSTPRRAGRRGSMPLVALVASNTCLLSVVLAALGLDVWPLAAPPVRVERARAESAAPARPAADLQSPSLPTLAISEIVVRLRDHPGDRGPGSARGRFVRIALELQFPDEGAKRAMSARLPKLRDVFRAYLSARTAQELRGGRGIQSAKMGLLEKVLETAPGVPVRGLYVSRFLLQ